MLYLSREPAAHCGFFMSRLVHPGSAKYTVSQVRVDRCRGRHVVTGHALITRLRLFFVCTSRELGDDARPSNQSTSNEP